MRGCNTSKVVLSSSFPRVLTDFVLHYFTNSILQAVAKLGWKTPTLIQAHAIREARTGKDLLARARTGSGKTGAYALAILNTLLVEKKVCNLT
jgi:superfamily II DNA/RNA helicase